MAHSASDRSSSSFARGSEFGVPLLPAEMDELNARAANADAVRDVVRSEGDLHASEFGGLYIDQKNGGAFTSLWTANLEAHAAAIWLGVRPGARLAFLSATYTYRDLEALQSRISADWDWMRAFGIAPMGVGVDVIANRVHVDVSSANPDATAVILAHYGAPPGTIAVESDGTGVELIPLGEIRGQVIDSLGKPPGGAIAGDLGLSWKSDGPGYCGVGDVGFGVSDDGTFHMPCTAGGQTIEVQTILVPNGDWTTLASGHVLVIGGKTVGLTVKLDKAWSSVATP